MATKCIERPVKYIMKKKRMYNICLTVEYVSSAHHVLSAHPPLQRQLPTRGTFMHVVSAHSNALKTHDAKRGYKVSIAFFNQLLKHNYVLE